jgi:hypothetical protein
MQAWAVDDGGNERNDSLGIYYNPEKKKRYLNDDNAVDGSINFHDIETMTPEQREDRYFVANP